MEKEKVRNILKKVKILLLVFVWLNVCVFAAAIIPNIKQPYPKEKMMMQSAAIITIGYIIPISKVFGNHNILTVPFYAVRDKLYDTAYSMYPKDEAEKDNQWYAVKYPEYHALYHPLYLKYFKTHPEKLADNKELWKWTDEFYNNAKALSIEKTNQPDFNKYIYARYVGSLSQYLEDRPLLFLARDNYSYVNLLNDPNEINRFNNILITSEKLKKDFQKNNPDSLNYFSENPNISPQEFINKHEVIVFLLTNKKIKNKFSCNDSLINKYHSNREEMINYLKNPPVETVETTNVGATHDDIYNWQLNKDLEKTIVTQCKMRLE